MNRAFALLVIGAGLLLSGVARSQPPVVLLGPTLVLLDGQTLAVKSLTIAGGKLSGDGVPTGLTLDDLRRIDFPAKPALPTEKPAVAVQLRGGGKVFGRAATIGDDKCVVEWHFGVPLSLPIDVVRAIHFEPGLSYAEFEKAVAAPSAESDRIFLKVDGKYDSLSGLVVSLGADELKFELAGEERTVPRAKLFGIAVAQPQAEDEATSCLVSLHGGSQLGGDLASVSGERGTLELPGGGKVEFPWSAVSRVEVRSSRVAFLSDLKPVAVEQSALVTAPRPWQRDKSVLGKPLKLDGRVYEKGIGVHARSLLSFAAGGKYDTLAAVIGIDDETEDKGDCVFTVLGDGQPLLSRRMKGSDPPQSIQIDIQRIEQVTLLVEPGADLDLADHADWCDVRLIRGNTK